MSGAKTGQGLYLVSCSHIFPFLVTKPGVLEIYLVTVVPGADSHPYPKLSDS